VITLRRLTAVALAQVVLLAAFAGLGAALGIPGLQPPEVRAATPDLTLVTAARYDVQPDQARVVITVDITATNHLRDTTTTTYYFDHASMAVLPGTSGFKFASTSSPSTTPSVAVSSRNSTYTVLRLNFGARLGGGKTATFRLRFLLPDPGGSATRSVRVGATLITFPLWAFASDSTPGSSVTLAFPKGYAVTFDAGSLAGPSIASDGTQVWVSGRLSSPLSFFAYAVGSKAGAYTETKLSTPVGGSTAQLAIRAWSDDPAWATRVGGLFKGGLPVLGTAIGLPWEWTDPLVVKEAVSRTSSGYAGLFDPSTGQVEVAYYAQPYVILHEAAHAWFNGRLLADRWANEAFASYYALAAAKNLKVTATGEVLTDKLKASRIPLNAWGPVGADQPATEDYAYAAALGLANLIATRAGADGLQATWAAASSRTGAYQPVGGAVETVDAAPDWRSLLDLLEAQTGTAFDDLWRTWVVQVDQAALLDARSAARSEYDQVVSTAGDWRLPRPVRDAMRTWQFADAQRLLSQASSVLDERAKIDRDAATAGLHAPNTLRTAFEGTGGFAAADAEGTAELETIAAIDRATATRPAHPGIVEAVGLLGTTPAADLSAAGSAFADGRLTDAVRRADAARATWLGAAEIGRSRLVSSGLLTLAALIAVSLIVAGLRPSKRAMAHRLGRRRLAPGWGSPYATLRDQPRGAARRLEGRLEAPQPGTDRGGDGVVTETDVAPRT